MGIAAQRQTKTVRVACLGGCRQPPVICLHHLATRIPSFLPPCRKFLMKRAARAFVPLVLAALSCAPAVAAAAAPSLAGAGDTGFGEVLHQQLLLRGGPLGKVATAWPKSTAGLQRTRRPPATSAPAARPPGGREVLVASVAGFGLVGATSLGLTSSAALHVESSRPVASADPPCASARASLGQPPASASLGPSEAVLWPAGHTQPCFVSHTGGAARRRGTGGGAGRGRARGPALGSRERGLRRRACRRALGRRVGAPQLGARRIGCNPM